MENSTSTPLPTTNAERFKAILIDLQAAEAEIDSNPTDSLHDKISLYRQLCDDTSASMSEIGTINKNAKAACDALQREINRIESKTNELIAADRITSISHLALELNQLIETNNTASQAMIEKAVDLCNIDIDESLSNQTKSDLQKAINNLDEVYCTVATRTKDARKTHIDNTFIPAMEKFAQQILVLKERLNNTDENTSTFNDLERAIKVASDLANDLTADAEKYINLEMDLATFQATCKTRMSPDLIEELTNPRGDWSFGRALNQLTQFIDRMLGQYSPGFASFFHVKTTTERKMNDIELVVDRMSAGM